MKKTAIVYWSGTGNTEAMAKAAEDGAKKAGGDVTLISVDQFSADDMAGYGGFLFGCPAMGDEVLEEETFEPFFAAAEAKLSGVPVGLFGSYGWGGGAWMQAWQERTEKAGAKLIADGLAIENTPDDDALKSCEELGKKLVDAVG